ncbi:MAG TPA: NADH-quinone oxidoreductase subunit M [Abditibacteriaceae bacterium]|nr:NADH-quinone oxidoreductase subunit M [Abditibacteriaceae bacterium]
MDFLNQFNQSVLSSLIFCPLVGAILVALLPRRVSREGAFVVAAINLFFAMHLIANWSDAASETSRFRFQEMSSWLPQLGVHYHLGVDGISVGLVLLTAFLTPLVILSSWKVAQRTKEFMVCLLLLEAAAIGVFCALDVILFYIFFEAVLVPTLLLIGIWGGARRAYAGIKFFVYTMAGSVLMWVAMLYIYFQQPLGTRSFDLAPFTEAATKLDGSSPAAMWLFGAFVLAFAIKAAMFPLHTWLPDAYPEAPTAGTVMLAAVLSKMGIYGFLRFAIPLFPTTAREFAPLLMALAIVGIIYGGFLAINQTDIKRVVAYSSISHLGLILLGVFAALVTKEHADLAMTGATIQMIAHGLSTGALFLLLGVLLDRVPNREMGAYGGLASVMPRFTTLFWIALFASIGLPGLSGFVGEYLIFQGVMAASLWSAVLATSTVILGAIYMLRLFRVTMYGEVQRSENRSLPDINAREFFAVAAILAVIVWIGVAPQGLIDMIGPDARNVATSMQSPTPNALAQLDSTEAR